MKKQQKMTHRKAQAWLAEYAADELAPAERQALAEHLEQCQACQKDLAEIQHIRRMLHSFALPGILGVNEPALSEDMPVFPVIHAVDSRSALSGRRYRSNARAIQSRERHNRKLVPTLAAVLLSLILVLSTVFVINLEIGRNSGPAAQPHSTPTIVPTPSQRCPTSTPVFPSPAMATATATPTVNAPGTPTPENCLMPTPNPIPTASPTSTH